MSAFLLHSLLHILKGSLPRGAAAPRAVLKSLLSGSRKTLMTKNCIPLMGHKTEHRLKFLNQVRDRSVILQIEKQLVAKFLMKDSDRLGFFLLVAADFGFLSQVSASLRETDGCWRCSGAMPSPLRFMTGTAPRFICLR